MSVGNIDKLSLDFSVLRHKSRGTVWKLLCFVVKLYCELFLKALQFSSVQFSGWVGSDSLRPVDCSMPGFPVQHRLPELPQTHIHQVSDVVEPSHPLLSPSPPAFNLSQHQGLFQWVSSSHQVAKGLSFSFSISPSNEYSGLISFRMDWFDTLLNYLFVFHLFGN